MRTKTELLQKAEREGFPTDRIAVAALLFDRRGRILLQLRGVGAPDEVGKLEGVGGRLKREDLHAALQEEFSQEIPDEVTHQTCDIHIGELLDFTRLTFSSRDGTTTDWTVATYLCLLRRGKPTIGETHKIEALHWLTWEQLYAWPEEGDPARGMAALSPWVSRVRMVYAEKYGSAPWQPPSAPSADPAG